MERNYWINRWKNGDIRWHQQAVEPELVRHFSDLPSTRILVPLCGKSLDLLWLAAQGHEVIGVEWSLEAIQAFFSEQEVTPDQTQVGGLSVYRSGKITLLHADFFSVTPALVGPIGGIYDRAALVALSPIIREQYALHICRLTESSDRKQFRFLQIAGNRTPNPGHGPPFSISLSELEKLYAGHFKIELLSSKPVEKNEGEQWVTEIGIYRLSFG